MRWRIGTSGWQYDHWLGAFYPVGLPKARWLEFYTLHFDTVELNNSFYRNPSVASWGRWRETVPATFVYAVKASRFISHFRRFANSEASLKLLFEGAEHLRDRFGTVLYQARPDFERTQTNVERLESFLGLLPRSHRHAFECRHASWLVEETLTLLRRHDGGFCAHDLASLECPLVATTDFAYARFHGPSGRNQGSYSDSALIRIADRLQGLGVDSVYVYFQQ